MFHAAPRAPEGDLDLLALSERFILWNFRAWACCCRGRRLPAEPVADAFGNIGAPAAAVALDAAMTRLVLATARPLAVHCPSHRGLSDDERRLVAAVAAAQRHDRDDLARLFGDVLPPPAVALVSRSLMELGAAIATVGVLLPQPGSEALSRVSCGVARNPASPSCFVAGPPDRAGAAGPTLH